MKSRTSDFFECKVAVDQTKEDGTTGRVTESYVVDALSFSEAETRLLNEVQLYVTGDIDVKAIKRANYHEIFTSETASDDKWYLAALSFITVDDKTEKEKRHTVRYLIQASSVATARKYIDEIMSGTMIDFDVKSIAETPFMDVFFHDFNASAAETDW